jgi:outer membrane scaffolding protein for murein synthesis (MipA/OmpV family)
MKVCRFAACLIFGCSALALGAGAPGQRPAQPAAGGGSETADSAGETATLQPALPAPPRGAVKPVFDETWATIGLGAGLVPSYAGSDNYIVFPLPLISGRVGGVGIRPNGAGLTFDLLSPRPSFGPRKARLAFGPAFRLRNDRNAQIEDAVVEAAGRLEVALEAGLNAAISFPGVFKPRDSLALGAQVRWDVLGAHEGMVIEPQVNYATPLGKAFLLQAQVGIEFVDDRFADYYFSVSPPQRAASGLPDFTAQGGLNRIGAVVIVSYDLSGNALDGGWGVFGVGGYSRLLGDAADTPYTSLRGSANQFIAGLGVGHTF